MRLDFNARRFVKETIDNMDDANLEIALMAKSKIEVSNATPHATGRMKKSLFAMLDRGQHTAAFGYNVNYAFAQVTRKLRHIGVFPEFTRKGFIQIGIDRRKFLTDKKKQALKALKSGTKEHQRRSEVIERFRKNKETANYSLGYRFARSENHPEMKTSKADSLNWALNSIDVMSVYSKWFDR